MQFNQVNQNKGSVSNVLRDPPTKKSEVRYRKFESTREGVKVFDRGQNGDYTVEEIEADRRLLVINFLATFSNPSDSVIAISDQSGNGTPITVVYYRSESK